jgi:hypothetical protein
LARLADSRGHGTKSRPEDETYGPNADLPRSDPTGVSRRPCSPAAQPEPSPDPHARQPSIPADQCLAINRRVGSLSRCAKGGGRCRRSTGVWIRPDRQPHRGRPKPATARDRSPRVRQSVSSGSFGNRRVRSSARWVRSSGSRVPSRVRSPVPGPKWRVSRRIRRRHGAYAGVSCVHMQQKAAHRPARCATSCQLVCRPASWHSDSSWTPERGEVPEP